MTKYQRRTPDRLSKEDDEPAELILYYWLTEVPIAEWDDNEELWFRLGQTDPSTQKRVIAQALKLVAGAQHILPVRLAEAAAAQLTKATSRNRIKDIVAMRKAARFQAENPTASLRDIGKAAGVDHTVVRTWQNQNFYKLVWCLTERINARGVGIDLNLVEAAQRIVSEETATLNAELSILSNRQIPAVTAVSAIKTYCGLDSLTHNDLRKQVESDQALDPEIRRIMELRLAGSKSSTAKLPAFIARTGADGRMRGNLIFHGSVTGRFNGQGAQLLNLPSRSRFGPSEIEFALDLIRQGFNNDTLRVLFDPLLEIVSICLRGMIVAGPGHDLIAADFNAIEARAVAWLAEAQNLLDVFYAGQDPYIYPAAKSSGYGLAI